MLTDEQIYKNKERFLAIVRSITREGVNMERLIAQLEGSDFFEAPASAIYHNAFRGGLCAHCLNVYDTLVDFCEAMYPDVYDENEQFVSKGSPYSDDTLKIVALFHDFDKMNKYERTVQNKKIYSETGTKYDEMGKYDWVSVPGYKRKDDKDVFTIGTHGENSVYMTETFIPLSTEEHCAIVCHHSKYDNPNLNTTGIYSKYHLACLLHIADMASTYVVES
jgi:hypothetical protein